MSVTKALYRSLLRTSVRLDRNPWARCFLIARPDELFDRTGDNGSGVVLTLPEITHRNSKTLNTLLKEFNGGEFYRPSGRTLASYVRQCFRNIAAEEGDINLDLGFMCLRTLTTSQTVVDKIQTSSLANVGSTITRKDRDWGIGVGPQPMMKLGAVEQGGFLVTHPTSCLFQQTLHRSVILLFEVDSHVGGLIVNKPYIQNTPSSTSAVLLRDILTPEAQSDLGPFLDHTVFRGGDVMTGAMLCLSKVEVEGSNEIQDGLFVSANFQAAAALVEAGEADASDFKFLVGHCGWTRVQLDVELARNVWFTGKAGDTCAPMIAVDQDVGPCDQAWARCLAGFGDEYAELAKLGSSDEELREYMHDIIAESHTVIQEGIQEIQRSKETDSTSDGEDRTD